MRAAAMPSANGCRTWAGSREPVRLVGLSMARLNAPQIATVKTRRSSSTRLSPARPCELCYRPLIEPEERFCASCAGKAKRLRPVQPRPMKEPTGRRQIP